VASEQLSTRDLHVISAMASGTSPRIPASRQQDLARFKASSLRQIAVRNGSAFFVADLRGGGLCTSIGSIGSAMVLGGIQCSPDFPSPARPLLDWSRFTGPIAQPQVTQLEGFAADGVASVAVVTRDGSVEAATSVEDNVYLRTADLPPTPIREIVALDANGTRLYSECFVSEGCSPR
jgi:hypothetical protein